MYSSLSQFLHTLLRTEYLVVSNAEILYDFIDSVCHIKENANMLTVFHAVKHFLQSLVITVGHNQFQVFLLVIVWHYFYLLKVLAFKFRM